MKSLCDWFTEQRCLCGSGFVQKRESGGARTGMQRRSVVLWPLLLLPSFFRARSATTVADPHGGPDPGIGGRTGGAATPRRRDCQCLLRSYMPQREASHHRRIRPRCSENLASSRAALLAKMKLERSALLFSVDPHRSVERLEVRSIGRIAKAVAEARGIDPAKWHPHLLRHTCGTHMHDHNAPLQAVGTFLGHARLSTASDLYQGFRSAA